MEEGWILNKLKSLQKILPMESSLSPSDPLVKECASFMEALHDYSPDAVSLGIYLLQEALRGGSGEQQKEKQKEIVKYLAEVVKSQNKETFDKKAKAGQMAELLEGLIEEGQRKQFTPEFAEFLKILEEEKQNGDHYILAKIKEGIKGREALSKDHPLYEGILRAADELKRSSPGVQEWSIYLFQQLLRFPCDSKLAQVILDYIERRVTSEEFKKLANPEDPDALNLAEEEFTKIGKQIHATLERKKLFLPSEVPENLKVSIDDSSNWRREKIVSDPRIALYNYLLKGDEKSFDQDAFNKSVESLVSLFNRYSQEGKIINELRTVYEHNNEGVKTRKFEGLAGEEHLQILLTYRGEPPVRFANHVIKIKDILYTLDECTQVALLASWAKAGFRCTTRSEEEISKFYTQNISEGLYLESEDDSLEMRISLLLALYRDQLLEKIVPQDTKERGHQVLFLKKHAREVLELINDAQEFEYKFEKLVERPYRYMVQSNAAMLGKIVMEGGDSRRLIPKGEGYKNPDKMIEFVFKKIGDEEDEKRQTIETKKKKRENIATKICKRFERDYGEDYAKKLQTYYDRDYKITKEGVRALLYSLGYLEKDLEPSTRE